MSAVVSQASIARAPHSQASGTRSQGDAEEAESPFADLLDSCAVSDTDAAEENPKAAESAAPDTVRAEAKSQADKPKAPESVQANVDGSDAEELSIELMLLLALGGQAAPEAAAPEAKEEKGPINIVPADPIATETKADTDGTQPQGETSDQTDPSLPQTVPIPAVVAAPLPALPEAAVEVVSAPESAEIAAAPMIQVPGKAPLGVTDIEKPLQADEAIAATLAAQPDKNKTSQAEKPTSTAAEQTLKTPAAFRSAASTDAQEWHAGPPKAEASNADVAKAAPPKLEAAEPTAGAAPKDLAAAPKAPQSDIEAPRAAAPQTLPDAGTNAPTPPAPFVTTSAGLHQAMQPVAGQANPTVNHVPISGLPVEIAAHAQAGKNHFEIRLDPPELGRIDVRLDVGSDGQVTSHLRVERAETLDLLRRDAPMLERALQQAGLKTSENGLQFSLRDQSFSWQQQQQQPETPDMARLVVPDEMLTSAETPRQYGRLVGLGSGVDIRV